MTFIDTRNLNSLETSLCQVLDISTAEMNALFLQLKMVEEATKDSKILSLIHEFVCSHYSHKSKVNYILLYQLKSTPPLLNPHPNVIQEYDIKSSDTTPDYLFNKDNYELQCFIVEANGHYDISKSLSKKDIVYINPNETKGVQINFFLFGPTKEQMKHICKNTLHSRFQAYKVPLSQTIILQGIYNEYDELVKHLMRICVFYLYINKMNSTSTLYTKLKNLIINTRIMYDGNGLIQIVQPDLLYEDEKFHWQQLRYGSKPPLIKAN